MPWEGLRLGSRPHLLPCAVTCTQCLSTECHLCLLARLPALPHHLSPHHRPPGLVGVGGALTCLSPCSGVIPSDQLPCSLFQPAGSVRALFGRGPGGLPWPAPPPSPFPAALPNSLSPATRISLQFPKHVIFSQAFWLCLRRPLFQNALHLCASSQVTLDDPLLHTRPWPRQGLSLGFQSPSWALC